MTATAPTAPVDRARPAQAEHAIAHTEWRRHVDICHRCAVGMPCYTADYFADQADAAGWRWQEAERRARGGRG